MVKSALLKAENLSTYTVLKHSWHLNISFLQLIPEYIQTIIKVNNNLFIQSLVCGYILLYM